MFPLKMIIQEVGGKAAAVFVAGVVALLGAVWLTVALFFALTYSYGEVWAAAITGLIALSPLALFLLWVQLRPAPRREPLFGQGLGGVDWRNLVSGFASNIQTMAKTHPLEALLVFLLIGFAAARRPNQLFDLVMAFASTSGGRDDHRG